MNYVTIIYMIIAYILQKHQHTAVNKLRFTFQAQSLHQLEVQAPTDVCSTSPTPAQQIL